MFIEYAGTSKSEIHRGDIGEIQFLFKWIIINV